MEGAAITSRSSPLGPVRGITFLFWVDMVNAGALKMKKSPILENNCVSILDLKEQPLRH